MALSLAGRQARALADRHLDRQAGTIRDLEWLLRFTPRDALEQTVTGDYIAAHQLLREAQRGFQRHVLERRVEATKSLRRAA